MIKNIDDQLVNGTVGRVVGFMTEEQWLMQGKPELPEEDNEKPTKKSQAKQQEYPVVEWKIVGSRNTRVEIVREETFKIEGPNGTVEVSRVQVCSMSLTLVVTFAYEILAAIDPCLGDEYP